jgi:hypothetical protein
MDLQIPVRVCTIYTVNGPLCALNINSRLTFEGMNNYSLPKQFNVHRSEE